jgi:hypothetical protein
MDECGVNKERYFKTRQGFLNYRYQNDTEEEVNT